jgi:proteic killer suppression protein
MIKRIRNKGLRELFDVGRSARVAPALCAKALLILDFLNEVRDPEDCHGAHGFHPLKGNRRGEFSMHVNGNWCITFKFDGQDVVVTDLEDFTDGRNAAP